MIWFAPFCALGDDEPDPLAARPRAEPSHALGDDADEDGGGPDGGPEKPDPDEPRASRR